MPHFPSFLRGSYTFPTRLQILTFNMVYKMQRFKRFKIYSLQRKLFTSLNSQMIITPILLNRCALCKRYYSAVFLTFRNLMVYLRWMNKSLLLLANQCPTLRGSNLLSVSLSADKQTATYSCARGYKVDGITTRQCQGDQQWSGVKPTCKSKIFLLEILKDFG